MTLTPYLITVDAGDETDDRRRAKDHAIKQGGTIEHEYKIIKGFSYATPRHLDFMDRS